MIYVVSDIHGHYDKYLKLLDTIQFSEKDALYVLGDVIDRGPEGFRIMLDIAGRPNVVGLLGNHEAMAMSALPHILRAVQEGENGTLSRAGQNAVRLWFLNGGEASLTNLLKLDAAQIQTACAYMKQLPLYLETAVEGRSFVLVHGGLGGFSPDRPLHDYEPDEILWCRPTPETVYFPDKYVIFGHTPVQLLTSANRRAALSGSVPAKIFRSGNLIDIDCGCILPTGKLGCLCLNTMEEFYV